MAVLTITFTRALSDKPGWGALPVLIGRAARTQRITILSGTDAASTPASIVAGDEDRIARVRADVDCWIAVGTAPEAVVPTVDAEAGDDAVHFLPADEWGEFVVSAGETVAVVGVA